MVFCDFLWSGGPFFYYSDNLFKPSTDSFLLGYYAHPKNKERVLDLGAGTGILGFLLNVRNSSLDITNLEMNPNSLELCKKTMEGNHFTQKYILGDLRNYSDLLQSGSYDYVVSNPPYFKQGSGPSSKGTSRQLAREAGCDITDVIKAASYALKWGGIFTMVFRPERIVDVMEACRSFKLEPKELTFVKHRLTSIPSLCLLKCKRGGNAGLKIATTWILEKDDGASTELVDRVYFRKDIL